MLTDEPPSIHWWSTFAHALPLHFRTGTVYTELLGVRARYELGPLGPAQAWALLDMRRKLSDVSSIWLAPHDPILEVATSIVRENYDAVAGYDVLLESILEFQSACNRDHDRDLAGILLEWLAEPTRSLRRPAALGTTAFQYVWEDMCQTVFGCVDAVHEYRSIASQPIYVIQGNVAGLAPQRPDIVQASANHVLIMDAKWYDAAAGELPGTPDVVKQMMYRATVLPGFVVKGNAFLVPLSEAAGMGRELAYAEMRGPNGPDERFPPIQVFGLPWESMVAAYCGSVPMAGDHFMGSLFVKG